MSTSTRSLAAASGASFVGAVVSAGSGFLLTLVLGVAPGLLLTPVARAAEAFLGGLG